MGCVGAGGVTTISSPNLPFLGNPTFSIDLSGGAPSSSGYLFLSLVGADPGIPVGAGCLIYLELNGLIQAINSGVSPIGPLPTSGTGQTSFVISVPNDPMAAGLHVYLQCAVADATVPGLALTLSNGLDALLN
jgi:hypothetical protein